MSDVKCPGCGLVYDLSAYSPGQRCRCRCGQILIAPGEEKVVRAARTIHCANCGGALEKGRPDCPFCGALVDLTDARLTAYCPSCLSMSPQGARFCCECGKELEERVEAPEEADERCPRCDVAMRRRSVGEHRPLECPMCCGLFVESADLDGMIGEQEKRVEASAGVPGERPRRSVLKAGNVSYLKCPVCSGIMNRVNYGRISGVIVDYCKRHGYWLDEGELEKIARWVATGGLLEQRQREIDDLRSRKESMTAAAMASSMHADSDGLTMGQAAGAHLAGRGLFGILSKLFD